MNYIPYDILDEFIACRPIWVMPAHCAVRLKDIKDGPKFFQWASAVRAKATIA